MGKQHKSKPEIVKSKPKNKNINVWCMLLSFYSLLIVSNGPDIEIEIDQDSSIGSVSELFERKSPVNKIEIKPWKNAKIDNPNIRRNSQEISDQRYAIKDLGFLDPMKNYNRAISLLPINQDEDEKGENLFTEDRDNTNISLNLIEENDSK